MLSNPLDFMDSAKTSLPQLICQQSSHQFPSIKVRPVGGSNPKLRVGCLPQQEIAQAVLPACSDDEIRVRQSSVIICLATNSSSMLSMDTPS